VRRRRSRKRRRIYLERPVVADVVLRFEGTHNILSPWGRRQHCHHAACDAQPSVVHLRGYCRQRRRGPGRRPRWCAPHLSSRVARDGLLLSHGGRGRGGGLLQGQPLRQRVCQRR
jgi:hypothetical protein